MSVASICRAARVANGTFYQYFPDKLALFQALVERLRQAFHTALQGARGIDQTAQRLFDVFDEAGSLFQIYREAEFLAVPHPRRTFYDEAVGRLAAALDVDEGTAWGVFGALVMAGLHFGVWEGRSVPSAIREEMIEVVARGIAAGRDSPWQDLAWPAPPPPVVEAVPLGKGEQTRRALVAMARRLFAGQGYAATHVAQIAAAAGVGLGTFYGHFGGKRELLAHLTESIREEMRTWVRAAAAGAEDHPLEAERRIFLAFLGYIRQHGDVYRIVREAEFAEPEIGRRYYHGIHADRIVFLSRAQALGQVRPGNPAVQACYLMGVEALAGLRWVLWHEGDRLPADGLRATLRLIFHGLAAG
ncbi:MAG: Transcriptional regulator, TetR family [Candidatus Ozemobacter sibiricus]|uniref:Transcriptional regulator, TetR family n=1 Tax=Candidatus Ozemobacter sibiricus TaxID=2268124 RepID=A0A367ZM41_9BACT|nr:MAG: Transcriptional regulator, TetR family [Candidatus Ozemobacter sibiricus]